MPIQFACENCQKNLKVPESAAGKRGRCNQCGHLNSIPAVASAETVSDISPAAAVAADPVTQPVGSASGTETYNVKSAVNGAVFGPADSATLKEWLDEGRITPNCQLQQTGTQAWTMASQMFPALGAAAGVAASAVPASDQFSQFQQTSAAQGKPGELNPYAPTLKAQSDGPKVNREIIPTTGDIGFCISHGWKVWTENFGLLLAVTATAMGISYAFQFAQQGCVIAMEVANDKTIAFIGLGAVAIVSLLVQFWLNLGTFKILCNLCRGERAEYSMLFSRARRVPMMLLFLLMVYLPFIVVGGGIFAAVGLDGFRGQEAGVILLVAVFGGLAFFAFLMLTVWPMFFMLADTDMGFELFGKGFKIGLKNCLIMIPILFVAGLVTFMGIFACFVGIIATIPAGQAMVTTAYLNMSGQLKPR